MAKKGWQRPTPEERAEHIRTLERLGRLVVDRRDLMVWFVLMSSCACGSVEHCDRPR